MSTKDLKSNLQSSPAARAAFLADTVSLLQKHGVDVNAPEMQSALSNVDLKNGANFLKSLAQSSAIITITA
jgi:hypothetical protein